MNKRLKFSGDPDHRLDTGIVFADSSLLGDTESGINRMRIATLQALEGIAIATMTSLRHRPTTDSHVRRALAEACTVPVLLVFLYAVKHFNAKDACIPKRIKILRWFPAECSLSYSEFQILGRIAVRT